MPILIRLFTDLTVYREVMMSKRGATMLRFCIAYLLISLVLGIVINMRYGPQVYPVIDTLIAQTLTTIPETVEFKLESGMLTATGSSFPLSIQSPLDASAPAYLFIDPQADPVTLASSSALFALGKTHFRITTDADGTHEIRSYQDEGWQNLTLRGQDIRNDFTKIQQITTRIKPYAGFILVLPIFTFYLFARLFHTLFYSLILRIFSFSVNRAYRFSHYWHLTLHTVIVADAINLLVFIVYQESYPLVFTIAFFGTTLLAYLNLPVEPKQPNNQTI